jgi:hypothetical protein
VTLYGEFLNKYNYDVRKTGDARWIDQKCTYDVLSIIADCIIEYVEESKNESDDNKQIEFTVKDIWHSEYARKNVIAIFSKPDPFLKAANEYDKYFGQPIKLLSYSKLLNSEKRGARYYYSINNRQILEKIALRPMNALEFLYEYITKVLKDSGIYDVFEDFFRLQTKDAYAHVRNTFIQFTINNTKINGETECGRIFTKVINPLAFKLRKCGTARGTLSKNIITLNDLSYNKPNWRDSLSGKDKSVTRKEHELSPQELKTEAYAAYTVDKAKKAVRRYNFKINEGKSEVIQESEKVLATQVHHIFSQSDYPSIADYVENLIMLTPNQHFLMAHPKNKTYYIDKDFQYVCLIAKSSWIYLDLTSENEDKFYNFEDYKYVLNEGLETNVFETSSLNDFASIIEKIDYFYSDLSENKYAYLVDDNKVLF